MVQKPVVPAPPGPTRIGLLAALENVDEPIESLDEPVETLEERGARA